MSEFIDANLPILIERGVPPQLAQEAVTLLDAQNRGELPCPLEGEELHIVRSAWTWMNAQDQHSQSTENSFHPQEVNSNQGFTFFDAQPKQQEPTPEEKDLQRLEGDIHSIFLSRRLLNKMIATFCAVVGSSAGLHLFARLGIPAIASGTIGGIVIAVCLGNALTKIRIDQGRPTIDSEFSLALAQALAVTGAMWIGATEYRQLSDEARQGRTEFVIEVQNFELLPQSPDFGRLGLAGIGVLVLLGAIVFLKGGKRNGY